MSVRPLDHLPGQKRGSRERYSGLSTDLSSSRGCGAVRGMDCFWEEIAVKRKPKFRVGQVVVRKGIDRQLIKIAQVARYEGLITRFDYRAWQSDSWFQEKNLRAQTKRERGE
jgi:hypothetical protein